MNYFKNIGKDKYKHAAAGIIFALIFTKMGMSQTNVFLSVLAVGIAKEVYDYLDYGMFDKWDVLATIFPLIVYYILTSLI
jgi:hypothetical protein